MCRTSFHLEFSVVGGEQERCCSMVLASPPFSLSLSLSHTIQCILLRSAKAPSEKQASKLGIVMLAMLVVQFHPCHISCIWCSHTTLVDLDEIQPPISLPVRRHPQLPASDGGIGGGGAANANAGSVRCSLHPSTLHLSVISRVPDFPRGRVNWMMGGVAVKTDVMFCLFSD